MEITVIYGGFVLNNEVVYIFGHEDHTRTKPIGTIYWCADQVFADLPQWDMCVSVHIEMAKQMVLRRFPKEDARQPVVFHGFATICLCKLFQDLDFLQLSNQNLSFVSRLPSQIILTALVPADPKDEQDSTVVFYIDDTHEFNMAYIRSNEQGQCILLHPWINAEARKQLKELFAKLPKTIEGSQFPALIRGSLAKKLAAGYLHQQSLSQYCATN